MTTDKILDSAIKRLRNGEEISTVVSSYPQEDRSELSAMLEIVFLASSLPRKSVPVPARRKLYLEYQPQTFGFKSVINLFKIAPTVMAAFLLIAAGTALGAHSSLPGDKLFAVKKSYESLQVKLATNPEKRASLQLEIAAQRFEDAQKVLAQDNNDESKKQAIEELNQQTVVALNDIKEAAVSLSVTNPSIVKKAEDFTKSQNKLIEEADPKIADSNAVQKSRESRVALRDIKKIIAAANDETGVAIVPSEKVNITGAIATIKDDTIRIAKNEFTVIEETRINGMDDTLLELSDLNPGDTVTVEAKTSDNKNIAETITVVSKGKVKGEVKEAPKDKDPVIPVIKDKPKTESKIEPKNTEQNKAPVEEEIPSPVPSNDTYGGFIPEPPVEFSGVNQ
jgi:hypothetical protein